MMKDFMDWRYCERKFIRRVEADISKARSLVGVAENRVAYWKGVKGNLPELKKQMLKIRSDFKKVV